MELLKSIIYSPPVLIVGGILFILLNGYVMVNYTNAYWGNTDSDENYKQNTNLNEEKKSHKNK